MFCTLSNLCGTCWEQTWNNSYQVPMPNTLNKSRRHEKRILQSGSIAEFCAVRYDGVRMFLF